MTEPIQEQGVENHYDLGHQGDVDFTQIAHMLAMTPTERLRHHESWRLFVKEAVARAKLHRGDSRQADPGPS
jgi:hypothetical protein